MWLCLTSIINEYEIIFTQANSLVGSSDAIKNNYEVFSDVFSEYLFHSKVCFVLCLKKNKPTPLFLIYKYRQIGQINGVTKCLMDELWLLLALPTLRGRLQRYASIDATRSIPGEQTESLTNVWTIELYKIDKMIYLCQKFTVSSVDH